MHIAVNNKPSRQTTVFQILIAELGALEAIRLSYDYIRTRFEGRYPEHIALSVEYIGPSRCKRYAQFNVEYKANGNLN